MLPKSRHRSCYRSLEFSEDRQPIWHICHEYHLASFEKALCALKFDGSAIYPTHVTYKLPVMTKYDLFIEHGRYLDGIYAAYVAYFWMVKNWGTMMAKMYEQFRWEILFWAFFGTYKNFGKITHEDSTIVRIARRGVILSKFLREQKMPRIDFFFRVTHFAAIFPKFWKF